MTKGKKWEDSSPVVQQKSSARGLPIPQLPYRARGRGGSAFTHL
jgi:hypothetical protein